MITDAHIHLPVGGAFKTWQAKKEKVFEEMKANDVSRCFVIADSWSDTEIGSTDDLVSLFPPEENSGVFVIGGISIYKQYQENLSKFATYLENRQIIGIKLFTGHENFYLTDRRLEPIYEMAVKYDVPLLFHSGWDNTVYSDARFAVKIAEKYPKLQLICCHCWYPDMEKCLEIAELPNTAFDISSVADNPDNLSEIGEKIKALAEKVPDRVLFGSDSFGCSMSDHINFVKKLGLDPETEKRIFSDNASRIYRI